MSVEVKETAPAGCAPPSEDRGSEISPENRTKGGPMVLSGRVGDLSSACTDRIGRLRAEIGRLKERRAWALAVGVDMPWSHKASAEDRGIGLPPLAGFRRDVMEDNGGGFPERACSVLDREGVFRAKEIGPSPKDRPEIGDVLQALWKAL